MRATSEEISREAVLPSIGENGRPLPLVGHWNRGQLKGGFNPRFQLELIKKGHHLLPWFNFPLPDEEWVDEHYEIFPQLRELNLPVSFVGTQWERILSEKAEYTELNKNDNPNFVKLNGEIELKVSSFGRESDWKSVGSMWTDKPGFKSLLKEYPRPPLVLFVSNNEHHKMRWHEAYLSKRFFSEYGMVTSIEKVRKIVGDNWINLYGALFDGMLDGLKENEWKDKLRFVGYGAFPPSALGRWPGWVKYSLNVKNRVEPWIYVWDGASVPYYLHDWNQITDFTVMSPQIEAMNWVFAVDEAQKNNENFWFELSIWDGNNPGKESDKRKFYKSIGQDFSEIRYGGYVRFGMWLLRPRLVREFRGWADTVIRNEKYFMQIVTAVDEVYANNVLEKFWRRGELVENTEEAHPYQVMLSDSIKNQPRWFLLTSDSNPPRPWKLDDELKVFAIALKLADEEEWLIYVYSPVENMKGVNIHLPGYGEVKVDSSSAGKFYHLIKSDNQLVALEK